MSNLAYLSGFGNHLSSESIPGIISPGRNSPQNVPHGLYAEQINGSAFTVSRPLNLKSWLYRIRPSVGHGEFSLYRHPHCHDAIKPSDATPPTQMRWDPMPIETKKIHFIDGLFPMALNGSINMQFGACIYLYSVTDSMTNVYAYNADGELLIVPQEGQLLIHTEFGKLYIEPNDIAVIPRGIKFRVDLMSTYARGYVCENYGSPFRLPDLGVIGANGLANPRDFLSPTASYEDQSGDFKLLSKFNGQFWVCDIKHSPLDVVAWHGNYLPYKYNLTLFNTINTVSFDHPDPSIFTVLSSPSPIQGVGNVDFVIFPPRWMVANDTFRPPYFHRNIMSEFMGLISGTYDAKETGFVPGSSSLHNCMSAHGPDVDAYTHAISQSLTPHYYDSVLAFMFESRQPWLLTQAAINADFRQRNYLSCWSNFKTTFNHESICE